MGDWGCTESSRSAHPALSSTSETSGLNPKQTGSIKLFRVATYDTAKRGRQAMSEAAAGSRVRTPAEHADIVYAEYGAYLASDTGDMTHFTHAVKHARDELDDEEFFGEFIPEITAQIFMLPPEVAADQFVPREEAMLEFDNFMAIVHELAFLELWEEVDALLSFLISLYELNDEEIATLMQSGINHDDFKERALLFEEHCEAFRDWKERYYVRRWLGSEPEPELELELEPEPELELELEQELEPGPEPEAVFDHPVSGVLFSDLC